MRALMGFPEPCNVITKKITDKWYQTNSFSLSSTPENSVLYMGLKFAICCPRQSLSSRYRPALVPMEDF